MTAKSKTAGMEQNGALSESLNRPKAKGGAVEMPKPLLSFGVSTTRDMGFIEADDFNQAIRHLTTPDDSVQLRGPDVSATM